MDKFERGDRVQVRTAGADRWVDATVALASSNGHSLAIAARELPGFSSRAIQSGDGGFFVDPSLGVVCLLVRENDRWQDVGSGATVEVRRARLAGGNGGIHAC